MVSMHAEARRITADGIVWSVAGVWEANNESGQLTSGDMIRPGSLLHPKGDSGNHSISILLPDGRRILYECFQAADCARGFRVPLLSLKPDPFATEMVARIHMGLQFLNLQNQPHSSQFAELPKDEAVVAVSAHQAEIGGLAGGLKGGGYTYRLRSLTSANQFQSDGPLLKNGGMATIDIPGPGLWQATVIDDLNNPRIDLFVAAVSPAKAADIRASFSKAKKTIADWNDVYQGWPMHDFLRGYLASLVLGIAPAGPLPLVPGSLDTKSVGAVEEPVFSPAPGEFEGDVKVTLRCSSPNATIHFTVDGSQPRADSSVYRSAIMVKGTALTIKAFASAPGKKDSPVITGIFRIKE